MPGRLPLDLVWRCAVIAVIPIAAWAFVGPEPEIIWQHAGGLHYQVRYTPGTDEACLLMRLRDVTPVLEPHLCWE